MNLFGLRKLVALLFVVTVAGVLNFAGHMDGSVAAQLMGATVVAFFGSNAAGKFGPGANGKTDA